jgi:mycothiol synthase
VFIPLVNKKLMKFIEKLKFSVERYSFLMIRDGLEVPEPCLPENYEIRSFKSGIDEEIWCEVRNTSFANLQGSETPLTEEIVVKMISGKDHIEGGSMILFHGERPVGVVRGTKDEYNGLPIMNIGPLAITPEYQGKGLGRGLLRASLRFAREQSYERTMLCVNAENERAKALYIEEGFKQVEGVVCYKYNLI